MSSIFRILQKNDSNYVLPVSEESMTKKEKSMSDRMDEFTVQYEKDKKIIEASIFGEMDLAVKNVKIMEGQDGYVIRCTLYRDGKRWLDCFHQGNGGYFEFTPIGGTAKIQLDKYHADIRKLKDQEVVSMYCFDLGCLVEEMAFTLDEQRQLKRQISNWCRTQVVFRLNGDEEGQYRTAKFRHKDHIPKIIELLKKKHGNDIEVFNKIKGVK